MKKVSRVANLAARGHLTYRCSEVVNIWIITLLMMTAISSRTVKNSFLMLRVWIRVPGQWPNFPSFTRRKGTEQEIGLEQMKLLNITCSSSPLYTAFPSLSFSCYHHYPFLQHPAASRFHSLLDWSLQEPKVSVFFVPAAFLYWL